MSRDKIFVVENGVNTCYMDSLLMALFYSPSTNEFLLKKDLESNDHLLLQEYIKVHFVDQVRSGKSITSEIINMIRNLCFQSGWRSVDYDSNPEEFFQQQDVNEFYNFIINIFNGPMIDIKRKTIFEASHDEEGKEESIPFIPLSLPIDDKNEIKISTLL